MGRVLWLLLEGALTKGLRLQGAEGVVGGSGPSGASGGGDGGHWLAGTYEVDFVLISVFAGVAVIGALVYLVRRLVPAPRGGQ